MKRSEEKMKNFNKVTVFVVMMMLIFSLTAFASSTTYVSTLDISTNSTVTGAYREYYENNHKMEMEVTSRDWQTVPGKNYIDVQLHKKTTFSFDEMGEVRKNCYDVGSTYTFLYGNNGTGTFRYFFSNFYNVFEQNAGYVGDAFTSDYLAMTSYD
jgi:hypothetical protein